MQSQYIPDDPTTKCCVVCRQAKPLAEFHRDKTKRDGHTSTCKGCAKERAHKWSQDNKERERQRNKLYYQEHAETIKANVRAYATENHEAVSQRKKIYHERNRERRRAYREATREHRRFIFRQWYLKNRFGRRTPERRAYERLRAPTYKASRKARLDALPVSFTPDDQRAALAYFGDACAVCGRHAGLFHGLAMDHWIPLSSSTCPGTIASNMLPLCHGIDGCNNRKHGREPEEWLTDQFGSVEAARIISRIETYFASLKT